MREKSIWGYHEGLSFSRRFIAHFAGFLVLFFLCSPCFHAAKSQRCSSFPRSTPPKQPATLSSTYKLPRPHLPP